MRMRKPEPISGSGIRQSIAPSSWLPDSHGITAQLALILLVFTHNISWRDQSPAFQKGSDCSQKVSARRINVDPPLAAFIA
jgi:hypothetical protein